MLEIPGIYIQEYWYETLYKLKIAIYVKSQEEKKSLMTSRGTYSSPVLFIHAKKDTKQSGAKVPLKKAKCEEYGSFF